MPADYNNPGILEDHGTDGYRIKRTEYLEEQRSHYYELIHEATGARYIHISNSDKENTFSVAFKTVPRDSTGIAHILEHTALCGSKRFPVRDPFFSMLKRSLSTFMNAFTASDWTMYPFSTQNRKDFYNLMAVYLDASFFPRLDELSFLQEGIRLETEPSGSDKEAGTLVYKGVVYNEMKGAMSSPSDILSRTLLKELFPETTYGNNSGGDPVEIPRLTYEQLVAFHKRHYHPSNAFFYTYGNLPLKDHLAFIQGHVLKEFERIDPETDVKPQPRFDRPKTAATCYPLAKNEDPSRKNQVCEAWLCSDIKDTFEVLSLKLLEHILIGNAASPLRKALIDSRLGSALSDSTGYVADIRDTAFACGLKDVADSDAEAITKIIFDVLEHLARDGVEKTAIESAIHQLEFHRREVTNSPYPYGIKLLLFFVGTWLHGGDPLNELNFDEDLARIRKEVDGNPFF